MAKANTANLDFFEKVGYTFGLIKESWEAFKLNWSTFILIWLMPFLLSLILIPLVIIPNIVNNDVLAFGTAMIALGSMLAIFAVWVILWPTITVTQIASVKGEKISLEQAFNKGKDHVWQFILAAIISFLIIIGPFLISLPLVIVLIGFFLIPLAILWMFIAPFFLLLVPYAIINENLSATNAIARSYELTKKNWQWILSVYIVLIAANFGASLVGWIPVLGIVVIIGLFIAYYCLPAYVYVNEISRSDKIAKAPKASDAPTPKKTTKKSTSKKKTKK